MNFKILYVFMLVAGLFANSSIAQEQISAADIIKKADEKLEVKQIPPPWKCKSFVQRGNDL